MAKSSRKEKSSRKDRKRRNREKRDKATENRVLATTAEMGSAPLKFEGIENNSATFERQADGAKMQVITRSQKEGGATHMVNRTPDVLSYYRERKVVTEHQYEAGERLRKVFERAGAHGVRAINLMASGGGGDGGMFASQSQATAFYELCRVLGGQSHISQVFLREVCCIGRWANDVAKQLNITPRYGIERFKEALDDLVRFYGIDKAGTGKRGMISFNQMNTPK